MTIEVKPIFQCAIADDPTAEAAGEVTPTRFNQGSEITMAADRIVGRLSTDGAAQELTAAQVKTLLSLAKGDVGLGNVDNTSDASKPVSTATQTALDAKVDEGAVTTSGLTMATSRLLGRTTASTGAVEEISIGSGLSLSAGSLSATGGGGGGATYYPDGLGLEGVEYLVIPAASVAAALSDVYTVPVGKRAFVVQVNSQNTVAASTTAYPAVNISGSYQRLGPNATVSSSGIQALTIVPNFIYEAGEKIAWWTGAAGINAVFQIVQFDSTSSLRSVRFSAFAAGDNTIYTPSGVDALLIEGSVRAIGSAGQVLYVNSTAGSRSILLKITSSSTTVQLTSSTSVAVNARSLQGATVTMSDGDSLILNSDSADAGQFAWVTVVEKS